MKTILARDEARVGRAGEMGWRGTREKTVFRWLTNPTNPTYGGKGLVVERDKGESTFFITTLLDRMGPAGNDLSVPREVHIHVACALRWCMLSRSHADSGGSFVGSLQVWRTHRRDRSNGNEDRLGEHAGDEAAVGEPPHWSRHRGHVFRVRAQAQGSLFPLPEGSLGDRVRGLKLQRTCLTQVKCRRFERLGGLVPHDFVQFCLAILIILIKHPKKIELRKTYV